MHVRFKLVLPIVLVVGAVSFGVTSAGAQDDPVITIPIDSDVRAPAGSETVLEQIEIAQEFVGATCEVSAVADNNSSVHPGNDVIISSGGSSVVLLDVEGFAGKVTEARGVLVLGPTASVTLLMGPDERFSAGLFIIECDGGPITTTTTTTTTTSTPVTPTIFPPSSTLPPTTTKVPTVVLPEIEEQPAPVPVAANPSFTG